MFVKRKGEVASAARPNRMAAPAAMSTWVSRIFTHAKFVP